MILIVVLDQFVNQANVLMRVVVMTIVHSLQLVLIDVVKILVQYSVHVVEMLCVVQKIIKQYVHVHLNSKEMPMNIVIERSFKHHYVSVTQHVNLVTSVNQVHVLKVVVMMMAAYQIKHVTIVNVWIHVHFLIHVAVTLIVYLIHIDQFAHVKQVSSVIHELNVNHYEM